MHSIDPYYQKCKVFICHFLIFTVNLEFKTSFNIVLSYHILLTIH